MRTGETENFERFQTIKIDEIIASTQLIHLAYRIFAFGVKPWRRKMKLLANERSKSMGTDSPSRIGGGGA